MIVGPRHSLEGLRPSAHVFPMKQVLSIFFCFFCQYHENIDIYALNLTLHTKKKKKKFSNSMFSRCHYTGCISNKITIHRGGYDALTWGRVCVLVASFVNFWHSCCFHMYHYWYCIHGYCRSPTMKLMLISLGRARGSLSNPVQIYILQTTRNWKKIFYNLSTFVAVLIHSRCFSLYNDVLSTCNSFLPDGVINCWTPTL